MQCYNPKLYNSVGLALTVTYDYRGATSRTASIRWEVANISPLYLTPFRGLAAYEIQTRVFQMASPTEYLWNYDYVAAAGSGEITAYGALSWDVSIPQPQNGYVEFASQTLFSPAARDARFTMRAGQTLVQSASGTSARAMRYFGNDVTAGYYKPGENPVSTVQRSRTLTFVGLDTVTVPAGTYSACKFEEFETGVPTAVTTTWYATGTGLVIKRSISDPQGIQTYSASNVGVASGSL